MRKVRAVGTVELREAINLQEIELGKLERVRRRMIAQHDMLNRELNRRVDEPDAGMPGTSSAPHARALYSFLSHFSILAFIGGHGHRRQQFFRSSFT